MGGRSSPAIKFQDFWLEHLFPIFFGTFCRCLAISAKNSFFSSFLPLSRQTNNKFGNNLKIFKASPHYRGKKLVEFDLDLLEITQIDRNLNFKLDRCHFCAAMEFSKKFKVLLGFDVVRLGSLKQRQLENFFQTQKFEIYKQNFHFFFFKNGSIVTLTKENLNFKLDFRC